MFAFGFFTIFLGPLGDRIGKTKILKLASLGTAIFSCLSIVANSLGFLILLRIANGMFAAGIMPVSMALVGERFDDDYRQGALAKLMAMMFLGGASATAISGAISYQFSWREVYFLYGVAELIIAFLMINYIGSSSGTVTKLNYFKIYSRVLTNRKLLQLLPVIFLSGFFGFGSFTYSGAMIQQTVGLNIFQIGCILSLFGLGALLGATQSERFRNQLGVLCLVAAIGVSISLSLLSFTMSVFLIALEIFCFGFSFILLHSTTVTTAQNMIPDLRGTIMALISFSVFVGSGIGTLVNKHLMEISNVALIFYVAAIGFIGIGIVAFVVLYFIQRQRIGH